jgi:uncharacterized protein involved in outer membrane biogenesis
MALTKSARMWSIVISIPILLLILIMIGAKLYFTSDRLKSMVIPKIESATNRHVELKDISLSVFPSLAVSIDNLKISNPEGSKFERDEFVSLDNLSINVKLFPLITGNIEIGRITLSHPSIYLEVTKEGMKNYSSGPQAAQPASGGSSNLLGGGLLLSDLEIKDGEFEMVDNKFDSRMEFDGIQLKASAEAKPGENKIVIDASSSLDTINYGTTKMWYLNNQPFKTTSRLSYALDKDILSFDDVKGQLRDLPISVSGTISQLQQTTNIMDLTITSPGASMEQLLSLIPPDMLKKTKGLAASGDIKFSVKMTGPSSATINPATTASFSITNGKIQYASLPKSITNITIAGSFEKPSAPLTATGIGNFSIDQFTARIGTNDISGKAHVSHFDDPTISASFTGNVDLAEVKEFYPLEQGSEFNGTVKATISVEGKVKNPESLNGKGTIDFQNVTIQSAGTPKPIRNLNGSISVSNQVIESKQLAMNIGESDLNLAFGLKNYLSMVFPQGDKTAGKPSATMKLTSHQLRIADITSESTTQPETKNSRKPAQKQGGILPGFDVAADVSIDKLVTDKFTFNNAKGSVALNNGVIDLKTFSVNAFQGTIQTKGTLDLRDEKKRPFNLDLSIKDVASDALLSNFTSFGQCLFGKLTMSTKIQGDLNDTLGINPQSLTGDGLVKISEGKLSGFPLTQKLAEFTGSNQLKEINFNDWANSFSIANGRLNVKDLKINAGATSIALNGSQGLDGTLDYSLTVKLPQETSDKLNLQGVAGELMQYFKDKDGRMNLPFHVGGTMTNPALQLDTKSQQEMAKKAAEDALKNKLQEGLKNIFKKP